MRINSVDIYTKKWAGTENLINQYGKLCFCTEHCRTLRDGLMDKGADEWAFWAQAQNALLDYNDYPPNHKPAKKAEYDSAVTSGKATRAEFDALKKQFDKDCK